MAAVPASPPASALTPPSSSHGGQNSWSFSVPAHTQASVQHQISDQTADNSPLNEKQTPNSISNGALPPQQILRPELSQKRTDTVNSTSSSKSNLIPDNAYLAPARVSALNRKDSTVSDTGSASDSLLDLYGTHSANRSGLNSIDLGERKYDPDEDIYGADEDPEHSRWIHRDKLARIESRELQAAGIILPRVRTHSKSGKRERSRDQQGNGLVKSEQPEQQRKLQQVGSLPSEEEEDQQDRGWDLRLPEEAAEDAYRDFSILSKGASRIPLSTSSPLPIPMEYIERDTPIQRRRSNGNDEAITYPKSRDRGQNVQLTDETPAPSSPKQPGKRTASDISPTKKAGITTGRNGAASAPRSSVGVGRPKTRSGSKNDTTAQRPPTRSGELGPSNSVKRPEGDPPWLASMFKPDPRLPPDQQLLPTVAKRLQQEQWEREGKFGSVYDKDFRPLNDEEIKSNPEIVAVDTSEQKSEEPGQWPLRGPKSPALSSGRPSTAGGYSTMPKINGGPQSPLKSTKTTSGPQPLRLQEPSENEPKKGGCGCCIVM